MSASSGNGSAGGTNAGEGDGTGRSATLRPPEWTHPPQGPVSLASITLAQQTSDPPVSRRTGPRAELAFHEARLAACSKAADTEGERRAASELARALVLRGIELDVATKLARRALLLGHDPQLREELSSWFAVLGEPALAAATLRPLVAERDARGAARALTRIGVLLGRSGDAAGAADALFDAARQDPSDPVPPELQAAIGAWAPTAVSAERAAEGYLEGFRRREASGDRTGAFEDLLRAFELAPAEPQPAERLAGMLSARGRAAAADEVLREHARASGERARSVHLTRLREAVAADDVSRALGAIFDARLEAALELESLPGSSVARLLERAGLHELSAARLELGAEQARDSRRAELYAELGRLFAGPLASPERALDAWAEALVADPSNEEARSALSGELAATGDASHWVGALLRIANGATSAAERRAAFAELARLGKERLREPGLSVWAARQAVAIEADPELSSLAEQSEVEAREQERRIAELQQELASSAGKARSDGLRELAQLLRGRPDFAEQRIGVLRELTSLEPDDRALERALERVLAREHRWRDLELMLSMALERPDREHERLRLALAAFRRRRGDARGALDALVPGLDDPGAHAALRSHAALLASHLGDERTRALALMGLAGPLAAAPKAVLLAVAAESLLAAGDVETASEAADQASRADPAQARAVGVLAAIALHRPPSREVTDALERAMGFIVPRAALCEALATAYEATGDPALGMVWTQRWLTLRPGDPRAVRALLGRVTESGDAQRIADALSWLLSQPQPLGELASDLSAALLRLGELDSSRGVAMARRALDVIGPRNVELRTTVMAIADAANEHGLSIAALERQLAMAGAGPEMPALALVIAARRRAAGDADGAAREIARAAEAGANPSRVLVALSDALPARSSDGELALLKARALALAMTPDAEAAARALRELGAARWDLAADSEGAIEAWERAALMDPQTGVYRYARDLVSFAGSETAISRLEAFAEGQPNRAAAGRVLAVAASVALGAGEAQEALRIASRALALDPTRADVLAVAERAASDDDLESLENIYVQLAEAALGRYGERAVHYRAARQFERRGHVERALGHALSAFEAVPAQGVTYVMMSRLADRAQQPARVVRVLERVADDSKSPGQRAEWLRRAAVLGGSDEESLRMRVDLLLRALSVEPGVALLRSLGSALGELAGQGPEQLEIGHMRFEHAVHALLPRLEGPEGARMAIAAAVTAFRVGWAALAFDAVECAIEADADVDEFSELADHVADLGREEERAKKLVESVLAKSADKYGNVGRRLLELGAQLARSLGQPVQSGRLLVAATERDPDDAELAGRAALAAELSGDKSLLERIGAAVPTSARVAGLMEMSDAAERSGDLTLAAEALERIAAEPAAKPDARRRARVRLREIYGRLGEEAKLVRVLEAELAAGELEGAARVRAVRDLATLLGGRRDFARALDVLAEALRVAPNERALLEDTVAIAQQAGDERRRMVALSALIDVARPGEKLGLIRELATLLEQTGDQAGAIAHWRALCSLAPNDGAALAALERHALGAGDYERAAELLEKRAAAATEVAELREIRLRRARILDERLGRADDARIELEALLTASGDQLELLQRLADLYERLGAPLRAAPLWMRASAAATTERELAEKLSLAACRAYMQGGDLDGARRVLDGVRAWSQSVEPLWLRVNVERRGGDPRELANALEELALELGERAEQTVALLVEAAYAHDAAGDFEDALAAADRAAQLDPAGAEPQLLSAWLEYRVKGPTTREHARLTVAALRGIGGTLTPTQAELRAFLVAEALDLAVGTGAGMRELTKAQSELGLRPLVALGIAERLVEGGEPGQALPLFDVALAGDLRELRARGRVALSAVHAAREAGELERAADYVEIAATDEATHKAAVTLQPQIRSELLALELARERSASRREGAAAAKSVPREEQRTPAPVAKAEQPGRVPTLPDFEKVSERRGTAIPEVSEEPPGSLPGPRDSEPPPAPQTLTSGTTRYRSSAPTERLEVTPAPRANVDIKSVRPSPVTETPPLPTVEMPQSLRRVSGTFAVENTREETLFEQLSHGSVDAGLDLIRQLENRRSRSQDLVAVCRRVVSLRPGDRELLRQLRDAALADKSHVHARAVEHVLAYFDPTVEPVLPPPLADQPEDPERVRALLFRNVLAPVNEALGLVWEGASHVFRREMQSYGVTGLDRTPLGSATVLGRAYGAAARVLGLSRTPLFQQRSYGAVTMSVALLTPASVIVSGEVLRETPELMFHLGAMLTATLPEHVLLAGSTEEQSRDVIRGVLLAFGPAEAHRSELASAASLAEVLWERIPARAQRRLREICHSPTGLDLETALSTTWRSLRRAGLFISGDLGATLRETCRQVGLDPDLVSSPASLTGLCQRNAAIAELVTLATSSELAAARWQPARGNRPGAGV